jgi:hypothetical protein
MNAHDSKLAKIWGTVFMAIVAPVLAGIGVNYIQKRIDRSQPEPEKAAPAQTASAEAQQPKQADPAPTKSALKEDPPPKQVAARIPERPVVKALLKTAPPLHRLFNGRDFAGFYTFVGPAAAGKPPYGKNKDPDQVFAVKDGMVQVSGSLLGALVTEKEFDNYHLTLEYKWGSKVSAPRGIRRSGVLIHGAGDDGAVRQTWLQSYRIGFSEDGTGNIFMMPLPGKELSLQAPAEKVGHVLPKKGAATDFVFKPGAPLTPLKGGWLYRQGFFQNTTAEKKMPGTQFEKPIGEWNTLECICAGNQLAVLLNGKVVNYATDLSRSKGRITLVSDGAEITFREITVRPQRRIPPALLNNALAPDAR